MAYTIEKMRSSADQVVNSQIENLTPQEQQALQDRFGPQFDVVRARTAEAKNRLKLTMYADLLESQSNIDYESWILKNVEATQVLINFIQPGALSYTDDNGVLQNGEDGIYGDVTRRCVDALFGLEIPVPVRSTPVVATVSGAVTSSLQPVARPGDDGEIETILPNGNDALTPEQMVQMRRTILSDSRLKGELEKIGIRFVKNTETENLDMIIPKGFESTTEYRQLQTYIKALHMTTDPEYTNPNTLTNEMRREKMEMFFEIVRGSGDYINGREFLAYKLINSINEDLKRDPSGPYIMTRSGEQGEYGIFTFPITRDSTSYKVISAYAPEALPYHGLLTAGNITDDYIDFATTYALVESNHIAFQGREFLGQATLVNSILARHNILGVSEEDVQDGNLLIADWDIVVKQINNKIAALSNGTADNVDAYQELMYVKNLIEGKEWMAEDRTKDMFREINTFGRTFLKEKSLIDDTIARLSGNGTNETTGEMIRNIAAENLFGLPGLIALFIAIFNIGGLGKAAGLGLLGAAGAMAGGSIYDSITDRTGDPLSGVSGGENLELVRIRQLQYGIKGGDALNTTLSKLYTENDSRNEKSRTTVNRALFVKEPLVLGKILFEVSESNDLSTLDLSDNTLATQIYTQMKTDGKLTVTGNEFTSNLSRNPTISQEDVNAFVEILRSQADGVDTTLGDILVAGDIDRLNHNYDTSWFDFTENSFISSQIHDTYRSAWATATREERKELLEIIEATDTHLFNGTTTDTAADAWGAAPTTLGALKNIFADTTGVSLTQQTDKIGDLTAIISASTIDSTAQTSVLNLLIKNVSFLEKQDEFNTLRTSWYDETTVTRIDLTGWLRFTGLPNTSKDEQEIAYTAVRSDISGKLGLLTTLIGTMTGREYDSLKIEVQKEIDDLNNMDALAEQKIIELADFATVTSGTGLDISQDINLAKVTIVAQGLQDGLRDSIQTGSTDYFGALNANIRQTIEIVYRDAANTARQGGDISTQTGTTLWNNIHGAIANSLGSIPKFGPVIKTAVTSYLPSPIDPTTNLPRVLSTQTLNDIEAQVKLGLIHAYITDNQSTIQDYQTLEDLYTAAEPDKLPVGVPVTTSAGGTVMTYPSDTPEQAKLRAILTTQHDTSLANIRAEILRFASSYKGAAQQGAVSRLSTSTLNDTVLLAYEGANQFVSNSANLDVQIGNIKTLVTATFKDNPDFLDVTLVAVSSIETDLNLKESVLRKYVEEGIPASAAIPAAPATASTPAIPAVLAIAGFPSPLDVVSGMNVAQIDEKISFANRLKLILGAPTTKLDNKIIALNAEKINIATLAEVPDLFQAIKDDLKLLTGSEDGIPTTTSAPFGQTGSLIGNLETGAPPATMISRSPQNLPSTPEYAVALKLREMMMGADSRPYVSFKSDMMIKNATYIDASGNIKTQDVWSMITQHTGLSGETLNVINIINSN